MPEQTIHKVRTALRHLILIQLATGVIVVGLIVGMGWWGQHSSCLRANEIREVALKRAAADARRAQIFRDNGEIDLSVNAQETSRASSQLRLLDCSRLIPED